jgi:hypothetical protein
MTAHKPYALAHTVWDSATSKPPFAAYAATEYRPRHVLSEYVLPATTARGAERQVRATARAIIAAGYSIVAVYWSDKGRTVYISYRSKNGAAYYCETFQPRHMAYAVYWDAETIARGVAELASAGARYPITARQYV